MPSKPLGLPRVPLRGPFVNGPYQVPETQARQAPRALLSGTQDAEYFPWPADRHGRIDTPKQEVVEIHVLGELPEQRKTELLLSDPRALKLGSIGVSSSGKKKKIDHHALFLFLLFGFLPSETFPAWDQRMHVLTNGCWRVVCFWLNLPKQTSPIVDATQGSGGKRLSCSTPPHSTHPVIVPGFQDNTRRWEKDLTLSRIRTPPCSRPADPTNT